MIYFTNYSSTLGEITLYSKGEKLVGLVFAGQEKLGASKKDDLPIFVKTKNWLNKYFSGKKPKFSEQDLEFNGSEFEKLVWNLLLKITYGQTVSYGKLAKEVAKILGKSNMSAQAIGGAVGRNPIAIIVPCHRAIGTNGKLVGYAGGLEKKIKLLKHEKVDVFKMHL